MVMQQLGDYDNRLWQQEVQQTERRQHTYTRLGLQMRNSVADYSYLYTRQRRAQRLRSQLHCNMYPSFAPTTFAVAFYLEPSESLARRLCKCRWVDGPGHSFAADSVEHFLLVNCCVHEGVGRRRQKLWQDIGALGANPELALYSAVGGGVQRW